MRRSKIAALAAAPAFLLAAACSDTGEPMSRRSVTAPAEQFSTPVNALDEEIQRYIKALFPTGLETAAGVR